MAQLDQLIGALHKHSGESLHLTPGQRPALKIDGQARAIMKADLDGAQLLRLLLEITPTEHRAAVSEGSATSFDYVSNGSKMSIDVAPGPRVVIRKFVAPAASEPAAAAAAAPAAAKPQVAVSGPLTMDQLFHTLVKLGGSDLHLSSECKPMVRVDGELQVLEDLPMLNQQAAQKILLSIAPERNFQEFEDRGDTDFAYEIEGLCRFRCNLFMDRKGPGGVFRVIPSEILTVSDLNLSSYIQDLCYLTKGLVLVTGPTGSGKSTTLAALVDLVNRKRNDHIITIEDPIEFVHPNKNCLVNQREVHLHTKGFKPALRAALREDPDIVLVGEMRDLETVAIAVETAETGHLVFGTLHTSSAVSTVDRLIDQFPADQQTQIRIMLSESLKAVIAQVLCKKIGGGRVAALEVMIVNAAVSNLIREGKTFQIPSIMQTGKKLGMVTMTDSLVDLVQKKLIDSTEAYMKAIDKASILQAFKAKNIRFDLDKGQKAMDVRSAAAASS